MSKEFEELEQAMKEATARSRRRNELLAEAAAFLARMAERCEMWSRWDSGEGDTASFDMAAADCRAMAAKLRGDVHR